MEAKDDASLADELASCKVIDRDLDARIAVALYSDARHADDRVLAPGTYWISTSSGLSLRTAPGFTSDKLLRDLAISALRRQQSGEAVKTEASEAAVERVAEEIRLCLATGESHPVELARAALSAAPDAGLIELLREARSTMAEQVRRCERWGKTHFELSGMIEALDAALARLDTGRDG